MAKRTRSEPDNQRAWFLARAHAYSITPQRKSTAAVPPSGGILRLDDELRIIVGKVLSELDQHQFTAVDFILDGECRAHDFLVAYAFGAGGQISRGGFGLGELLGHAMDLRSTPSLLLLVLEKHAEDDDRRRQTLLLLTQRNDAQLQLEPAREADREAVLKVLHNTFNADSDLRKVARFEGRNSDQTRFASGEVADFQSGTATKIVADYWTERYLTAKLRMGSGRGTQLFVEGMKAAIAAAGPAERSDVAAVFAQVRSAPRRAWTVGELANKLPVSVRTAFLKSTPDDARQSSFLLDVRALSEKFQYRVFDLEGGVAVYAPPDQVGVSVFVDDRGTLRCAGKVLKEKFTSRKA